MAEGHGRDEWARAARICALIANSHSTKYYKEEKFNPYKPERQGISVTKESIGKMKQAFEQLKHRRM